MIYRGAVEDLIDGALYSPVVLRCPGEAARRGHLAEKAGKNLCPIGWIVGVWRRCAGRIADLECVACLIGFVAPDDNRRSPLAGLIG